MVARYPRASHLVRALTEWQLLDSCVTAFDAGDIDGLAVLLRDDVWYSMPLFLWCLRGVKDVFRAMSASGVCAGSRLVPVVANAAPAFARYRPASGWITPCALMTMELSNGAIGSTTSHLRSDARFQAFGLPLRLDSEVVPAD